MNTKGGANVRDYTNIQAWQLADDLTVHLYSLTRSFPREELYSLTNQLRRAAYSVPANIAEGASRESKRDYLHFLYIARGSLMETQYFVHLSQRLGYLSLEDATCLMQEIQTTAQRLQGLVKAVQKEAGVIGRSVALFTSLVVIGLASLLRV